MAQEELSLKDNRWSLKGMTAFVTGGSRGIGYAVVEELAAFGVTIHTCSLDKIELDEKLQEWKNKGFNVTGTACDVLSRSERESLMEKVASIFNGKLNILNPDARDKKVRELERHDVMAWHGGRATSMRHHHIGVPMSSLPCPTTSPWASQKKHDHYHSH